MALTCVCVCSRALQLKTWDLRQGAQECHVNSRAHGAGVCCAQSSPHRQHQLLTGDNTPRCLGQPPRACTAAPAVPPLAHAWHIVRAVANVITPPTRAGSYDQRLRVWDARMPAAPLLAEAVDTGGGVWRVKWHPSDESLVLAACMHAGFAIARCEQGPHVRDAEAREVACPRGATYPRPAESLARSRGSRLWSATTPRAATISHTVSTGTRAPATPQVDAS